MDLYSKIYIVLFFIYIHEVFVYAFIGIRKDTTQELHEEILKFPLECSLMFIFHLCGSRRYEFHESKACAIKLRAQNYAVASSISMTNFTRVSGASSLTEIILARDIELARARS